jgi:GDP-L-fucose synthase
MKKILVTGGTGFLGSYVVEKLTAKGYTVVLFNRKDGMNLTNFDDTLCEVEYVKPDAIIHLAAKCGGIGANMDKPGEFFTDNLKMGMNIIEAARILDIPKLLCVGTVCSYPAFTPTPFSEDYLWQGYPEETNAPYGIAKKALLVMLQAYRKQYGMNGIYIIPVNLYGPRDNFHLRTSHVIPALIRKFHEAKLNGDKEVICWGTGSATREFLYVEDAAIGLIKALENYNGQDPINLGNGKEYGIGRIVKIVKDFTKFDGRVVWDVSKPNGQKSRCLDISKAKELFGFEAKTNIMEGILTTYQWYAENRDKILKEQ